MRGSDLPTWYGIRVQNTVEWNIWNQTMSSWRWIHYIPPKQLAGRTACLQLLCFMLLTQFSPGKEHKICHRDYAVSEPKSTTEIVGRWWHWTKRCSNSSFITNLIYSRALCCRMWLIRWTLMPQRLQRVVAVTRPHTLIIKCQFHIFGSLIQIHAQNFLFWGGRLTLRLYRIHVW